MGGTFRFMTYFVKVMAFLCASAYKGAKVYSLMHFLQAQDLYRNYMFHLKLRHCVLTVILAQSRFCPTIIIITLSLLQKIKPYMLSGLKTSRALCGHVCAAHDSKYVP